MTSSRWNHNNQISTLGTLTLNRYHLSPYSIYTHMIILKEMPPPNHIDLILVLIDYSNTLSEAHLLVHKNIEISSFTTPNHSNDICSDICSFNRKRSFMWWKHFMKTTSYLTFNIPVVILLSWFVVIKWIKISKQTKKKTLK